MSGLIIALVLVALVVWFYYYKPLENTADKIIDACLEYKLTDKNVSKQCLEQTWKNAGCSLAASSSPSVNADSLAWYQNQPYSDVINDVKAWSTLNTGHHRTGCYGSDRTKWPASA